MKKAYFLLCTTLCATLAVTSASEVGADRILKEHRLAMLQWQQQVEAAPTRQAKEALIEKAPDSTAYGQRMMQEIGADLGKEWTLPYSTWLMQNNSELKVKEVLYLMNKVEQSLLKSPEIGKFCIALVGAAENDDSLDPNNENTPYQVGFLGNKITFIENVLRETQDKRVKGEASLALSVALGKMGGAADLNKRRLDLLRTAIIEAVDSKVGDVTVGELAQEELYRMTKLTKGQVAPDLVGTDAHGQPLKLSNYRGKVVMLVFWCSWENGPELLDYLRKSAQMHEGKAVQIVTVNKDTTENLKTMVDMGRTVGVTFTDPNAELFTTYRVSTSPWCVVLNKKGVIEYTGPVGSFADLTIDAVLEEKE